MSKTHEAFPIAADLAPITAEELAALSQQLVRRYVHSRIDDSPLWRAANFCHTIQDVAAEVTARCKRTPNLLERAYLSRAAHALVRTSLTPFTAAYTDNDRTLVEAVETVNGACDFRILHAALHALTLRPLTNIVWDEQAPGLRRYVFTQGGDLYTQTLQVWAERQLPDGSWADLLPANEASATDSLASPPTVAQLEEANGRIAILKADFGSFDTFDTAEVARSATNFYSRFSTHPSPSISCPSCATFS